MDATQLLQQISARLDSLSAVSKQLLNEGHGPSALDKELLKQQCTTLYELILKMETVSAAGTKTAAPAAEVSTATPVIKNEEEKTQPVVPEQQEVKAPAGLKKEDEKAINVAPKKEEVHVPPVQPVAQPKPEVKEPQKELELPPPISMEDFELREASMISDVMEEPKEEEAPAPVMPSEEMPKEKPVTEPIPTLFNEPPAAEKKPQPHLNIPHQELLHEKISNAKLGHGLKDQISDARVENLKAGITLNKKIAFVNELFKENTVEYAKAIDRLNSSADLNEALRYFNELKHHYAWNNDNELVVDLEQLIQKRFR